MVASTTGVKAREERELRQKTKQARRVQPARQSELTAAFGSPRALHTPLRRRLDSSSGTYSNLPSVNTLSFLLGRSPAPNNSSEPTSSADSSKASAATPGDSWVNPAASAATGDVTAPPSSGTPSSVLKLSFNRSSSGKGGGGGGGGSGAGWNPQRAKIQLKLAIQRLRLVAGKKTQLAKTTRREIASLLEKGKIESAGIKVEGVMGDDLTIELLEMLELYCELLLARFGLLEQVKEIDPGVSEAVIGIIHAAPRTELKELHILRDMLMAKGGRDFAIACMDNTDSCVSERITSKLIVATPPPELVDLYLYEIAKAYCIDWRPQGFPDPKQPVEAATPANAPVPTAPAIPSTPTKAPVSLPPFDNAAGFPQTPPVDPSAAKDTVIVRTSLPSPGIVPPAAPRSGGPALRATPAAPKNTEEDAFEVLTKRFAELKKR